MAADGLKNRTLGDYTVRDMLGKGGMAEVYQGYDPNLDREVAIKVIYTAHQPAEFVSRFQREARTVASLRHPNIVQIYQFGEQDGIIYMVQELLPGPTLAQPIKRAGKRGMALSRVQTTLAQLAAALDFAHAQGITHRDVKPSNALYNAQGELVLTDFGIARTTTDATQTATGPGIVMGTPGYVAPEQAISSAAITPACDIYALGVVLFELLTGRLPFAAPTPMELVLKHLYETPPPPSSLRSNLPSAVDAVLARALDKEPEKRYRSAGALAQACEAALAPGKPASKSTSKRSSTNSGTSSSKRTSARSTRSTPESSKPASKASPNKPASSKPASSSPRRATNSSKAASRTKPASASKASASKASPPDSPPAPSRRGRVASLLVFCLVGALILGGLELQTGQVSAGLAALWQTLVP